MRGYFFKDPAMLRLKGIYPPLPTSYHDDEELYPRKIRENIESLLKYDLSGFVVLGSNGELVMLSAAEKEVVYAAAREAIPADRLMIAGCGGQSTRETVRLVELAARCGADSALILNPFYYKGLMNPDALVGHYHDVAGESGIPLIIYNMPANSGIDMDAETILRIAEHPNVVGLKDSGGDIVKMAEVAGRSGDEFQVLAGSAGFLLPALEKGAVGGILTLANVLPQACLDILDAFSKGNLDKSREMQKSIVPINTALTRQWGIPALKAAMDHVGRYGGPSRKPILPLDESGKKELWDLLKQVTPSPEAHPG